MQESPRILMGSPLFSPSSDKRFWSALRSRIDALLEERNSKIPTGQLSPTLNMNVGDSRRAKRLKEDALLLTRGFDSVAHTLSQLSNNLDTALQRANDLAKLPNLLEIFHSSLKGPESESEEEDSGEQQNEGQTNKGLKRKYEHCSERQEEEDSKNEKERVQKMGSLRKPKMLLAISMATKAASLVRELKSIKSNLCFMQERCSLLEEENRRLRDGFSKGI